MSQSSNPVQWSSPVVQSTDYKQPLVLGFHVRGGQQWCCNGDIKVRDEKPQTLEEVHYKSIF